MNTHFLGILQALDNITEGGADYQKEYKQYIEEHKERVKQYANWLKENLPELFDSLDMDAFDDVIAEHDDSKYSEEEFEPYAQKWYNNNRTPEYDEACKHHVMNNEHHPDYWLGEDMPYIYILEMICDWGSFGIAKDDMGELIDFYYSKAINDEAKSFSDNTKEIVEEILSKIESKLKTNA